MLQKILKISLIISLPIIFNASGCEDSTSGDVPPFGWKPKIYIGDSKTESYVRMKDDGKIETHLCKEPDFDNRVVISKEELSKVHDAYLAIINKCDRWK